MSDDTKVYLAAAFVVLLLVALLTWIAVVGQKQIEQRRLTCAELIAKTESPELRLKVYEVCR